MTLYVTPFVPMHGGTFIGIGQCSRLLAGGVAGLHISVAGTPLLGDNQRQDLRKSMAKEKRMVTASERTMSSAAEVRKQARHGGLTGLTAGMAPGYAQANMAILPRELAYDFLLFCMRNPKPCPVLDVTEPGSPVPHFAAPDADLRTDLPRYRVFRHGELVDEPVSIESYWTDDLVAFLLGCSFSFEQGLLDAGIPLRHVACGGNVAIYRTNVACRPAGIFHGPLVVSMRPIPAPLVARAVQVSGRYPSVHGAPVHVGAPEALGIRDLAQPDWGDFWPLLEGEVPVFWACGVTPQAVAMAARPPLMITHAPGSMFVTDIPLATLAVA